MTEISIVIPAYNEEDNLSLLLDEILRIGESRKWNYEIIVVNDNSSDGTENIIVSYAKRYQRIVPIYNTAKKRGLGIVLTKGTKIARGDIIIWTMADRSDELGTIPLMIKKIKDGCDIVVASRYSEKNFPNCIFNFRFIISRVYSFICKILFNIPLYDITNAFRCFKMCAFESLNLISEDFTISAEFIIKAHKKGLKLDEVSSKHFNRRYGKSKLSLIKISFEAIKLIIIELTRK